MSDVNRKYTPVAALWLAAIFASSLFLGVSPAAAQSVVVLVNGDPITNLDIDQRTKFTTLSTRKRPSREEVINELIDEKVMLKEGRKFGLDMSEADVNAAYAGMAARMRLSPDQLTKQLAQNGIRPDTLKDRTKAQTVWAQLVRGRFKGNLQVGERDVNSILESSEAKDADSFEYRMRPIVLVIPRGAPASLRETRRKEAEALRNRIQSCDEAVAVFRTMRDATLRPMVVKTSADLPQQLRERLDKVEIGHLTEPEVTKLGIEMAALCARVPTTADSVQKRQARDKLFQQKFEAQSKEYLARVRRSAMIEYRSK